MLNDYIPGTAEHLDKQLQQEFVDGGPLLVHAIAEIQQLMAGRVDSVGLDVFLHRLSERAPELVSFVQGYLGGASELPRYVSNDSDEIPTAKTVRRDVLGRYLNFLDLRR